jgi:hypothetical protein
LLALSKNWIDCSAVNHDVVVVHDDSVMTGEGVQWQRLTIQKQQIDAMLFVWILFDFWVQSELCSLEKVQ